MEDKLDKIISLLSAIDQKMDILVETQPKVKPASKEAILKQFEETEKLFNKVMSKGK